MAFPQQHAEPAAAAPPGWPTVAGTDGARAAELFDGDAELFLTMLRRLVRDFGALADDPPPSMQMSPDDRQALKFRMHKLRGAAGMIACDAVRQPAAALEATLVGRPDAGMLADWAKLQSALRALRDASAAVLATASDGDDEVQEEAPPLDDATFDELCAMLQRQDLDALDLFTQHRAALRQRVGADRFAQIAPALESLDFRTALEHIQGAGGSEAQPAKARDAEPPPGDRP